ncbi:hypothetical protein ACLB2K_000298 [Fragaria x ananassa]
MTFVIFSYFQVFKLGLYIFFIQCKPVKDNKDDNEVVRRVVKEMCKMCKAIEENDEVVCRVYYLQNHYPEEVTKLTGYVWRTAYNDFNDGPKHQRMIEAAIAENPIMKKVYEFGEDEDVPAAEQQKKPKPIQEEEEGVAY